MRQHLEGFSSDFVTLLQDDNSDADHVGMTNPFADEAISAIDTRRERRFGRDIIDIAEDRSDIKLPTLDRQVKDVCEALSEVMINERAKPTLPSCDNIEAIQMVLDHLKDTPVCLGWGELPVPVSANWQKFMNETVAAYRTLHDMRASEIVPFTLTLPEWMQGQRGFDLLAQARLVDVTIVGDIAGQFAKGAEFSRITVQGDVKKTAVVGDGASRCNFVLEGNCVADLSFNGARNVSIIIKKNQSGRIGQVFSSRVKCEGRADGYVTHNTGDSDTLLEGIDRSNSARL